ncbi:stage II sporulation protein R [Cohnella panacarvi]|uniref:stage II sporulation protein R n=1 Tax=Cohnella panacarvi TaxID=400776 RepID=UPI00047A74FE|nr:stage II sporulation protein R [Cohnella panacarvi]
MRVQYHSLSSKSIIIVKAIILGFVLSIGLCAAFGRFASAQVSVTIPEDAIRIRIIASSDSGFDQAVKQDVRERVSRAIGAWGEMPATHDAAQSFIRRHMKQLQKLVNAELKEHDVDYKGVVELADVPFPEKSFEGTSYPAGEYEALRITLGDGEGSNWWCVLFPPMCLTAATAEDPDSDAKVAPASLKSGVASVKIGDEGEQDKPKPMFFLVLLLQKLFVFIAGLFS